MRSVTRLSGSRGFTLIELLIVVAIIGIIAAMLIPNFLDVLQKAKQKRTMADMKLTGTAWFSWMTDQFSAAAAGQRQVAWGEFTDWNYDKLKNSLVPRYTANVPAYDGWKSTFAFAESTMGMNAQIPIAIRSKGSDKEWDTDDYVTGPFITTDYQQDIVWAAGFFIRWPSGIKID
jgi:prepilin-type N-terminal cleavage/methylation domain-containing protein